jgi:hypothetical protein
MSRPQENRECNVKNIWNNRNPLYINNANVMDWNQFYCKTDLTNLGNAFVLIFLATGKPKFASKWVAWQESANCRLFVWFCGCIMPWLQCASCPCNACAVGSSEKAAAAAALRSSSFVVVRSGGVPRSLSRWPCHRNGTTIEWDYCNTSYIRINRPIWRCWILTGHIGKRESSIKSAPNGLFAVRVNILVWSTLKHYMT